MKKNSPVGDLYLAVLRAFIFWIAYFYVSKVLFLTYEYAQTAKLTVGEVFTAFFRGTLLDISASSYVIALMFVFSAFLSVLPKIMSGAHRWLHYIFIVLFSVIQVGNLELYRNWGFHVDTTPLLYINTPKEMTASTPLGLTILLIVLAVMLSWGAIAVYRRWFYQAHLQKIKWYWAPVLLISAIAMFIPIRGGIGIVPLNSGSVYFSNKQFANHLAVNPVWNFQYSISKHSRLKKSHHYMDDSLALSIATPLRVSNQEGAKLLKLQRPNIVVIVLESFTAKLIGAFGGEPDVTPQFNALAQEGVKFSNFYSTADRSDKGLVAIMSGMPALPTLSMNKFPQKTQFLPGFPSVLKEHGYSTHFYYGGNINFANLKSYLMNAGIDRFVTETEFDPKDYNSKWGVHDHIVFQRFFEELPMDQPFFKAYFTLSSHEPFDIPVAQHFEGGEKNEFRSAVYYTDSCLGDFFIKAKQSPLWDSTLFILVADHGSRHPNDDELTAPSKNHIPMLWLGGALNVQDTTIDLYASQHDIPATLLAQLGISDSSFMFSRNILSPDYFPFGFFTYNNGFGFLSDSLKQIHDNGSGIFYVNEGAKSSNDSLTGKAYLQSIWMYFMDL